MRKIWLVFVREYLIRVRKKTFIIATLLTPIGFGVLMIAGGYFASKGGEAQRTVIVKDDNNFINAEELESSTLTFKTTTDDMDALKNSYTESGDILVHVTPIEDVTKEKFELSYYSNEKLSINTINRIEGALEKQITNYKIAQSDIDMDVYKSFETDVDLEDGEIREQIANGEEPKTGGKMSVVIGTALGGLMGFLMYMVIFIYGGMVMRSVMEEKINRVIEVMISSIKPVQLMLGKVFGVGAVGLTQLALWLILIPAMIFVAQTFFNIDMSQTTAASGEMQQMQELVTQDENTVATFLREFKALNWFVIIPTFVLFFFGGYFMYASLFAAIGSAIGDDMGEGQQLMLPLMIPVIIAFIMLQGVLSNPNGQMAVIGSMIPLLSPILMPARLAFDPPMWQILLSILLMIATCIFFAWLAGRIYRVGVLMYGKKVNFREIGKWLFYKE